MKTIRFISCISIVIGSVISGFQSTYAYDNINWGNMDVEYNYDYSNEKLDIKISIDQSSRPSDDYSAKLKIDGESYNKDFLYDSGDDELYLEYSISMDHNYSSESYPLQIKIINEDTDSTEYQKTITVYLDRDLDWENLEIENEYNSSSENLQVTVALENINNNPNSTYYSYFKINNNLYSASFWYSSRDDKYYAVHNIYIDRDDIDDDYRYQVDIKNKNYATVYKDSGTMSIDGYSNRNYYYRDGTKYYYNNNIDWNSTTLSNYYNPSSKELNLVFSLPNVNKTPSKDYYVVVIFNGKEYTKKFTYLDDMNKLYATLTFSIGSVKNFYDIDYSIIYGSSTIFSKDNIRTYINKTPSSNTTNQTYTTIKKYNTDDIAEKIINIAEEKYSYAGEKIIYLERVSNKLDNFFGTKPQYKAVINSINGKLRDKINYYQEIKNNEDDVFGLDDEIYFLR